MENIFVEFLPPWVETGLQPAFYDKESGTVLQQTARMYARVNMLIRMFNKLSKQTKNTVETYINKFNELHDYVHDYFDNLDVQEEINNKLDQMAEDGVLTDIIAQYLTLAGILVYDTVQDLSEATNVAVGSKCMTYGYLRMGDGVYNIYNIREITNTDVVDGYNIVSIQSSNVLIAERLQYGKDLVIELTTDDDLEDYLSLVGNKTIILPSNSTLTFTDAVVINSDTTLDLNGSTVFFDYTRTTRYPAVNWDETLGFMSYDNDSTFTAYDGYKNITIKNGKIKGGCSCFMHSTNVLIENVEFIDVNDAHNIQLAACNGFTVKNCIFHGTGSPLGYGGECINLDHCNNAGQPYVINTSVMYDYTPSKDVNIIDNIFDDPSLTVGQTYVLSIGCHSNGNGGYSCIGLNIINNDLGTPATSGINISDFKNTVISKNRLMKPDASPSGSFITKRGKVDNLIISDNTVYNTYVFYSVETPVLKTNNVEIINNNINCQDGNYDNAAVIKIFNMHNANISGNVIKYQNHPIFSTGRSYLEPSETDPSDNTSNVTITNNSFIQTINAASYFGIRIQKTDDIKFIGNNFKHMGTIGASFYEFLMQDDTTNTTMEGNTTDQPWHWLDATKMESSYAGNNALYTLSGDLNSNSTSGTFAKNITNFSTLVLLCGTNENTQVVKVMPYLTQGIKFDGARTFKCPVAKNDGTAGTITIEISNDGDDWAYTGDINIRKIYAMD